MSFLFELPFATVLFILAFYCFSYLPKRIEVLYYKEHIPRKRVLSTITGGLLVLFVVSYSIYSIYEYGFNNYFSYAIMLFLTFFLMFTAHNLYRVHIKNEKRIFSRKVYYGLEEVKEEIESIKTKYPEINIKTSIANSPVFVIFRSNDKTRFQELIDLVNEEKSIFKDLDQPKYKNKLKTYIGIFSISVIYLIMLGFWQFIL